MYNIEYLFFAHSASAVNMTRIQKTIKAEGTDYLFDSAKQYVLNLWNEQRDKRLTYHNFAQAAGVVSLVQKIGAASERSKEVIETATLAAWFHNTGYLYDYQNFAEKSAVSAEFFLAERRYAPEKIHRVHQCIITAVTNMQPMPLEAQLLSDAMTAYTYIESFDEKMPLLRLEHELVLKQNYTDTEWDKFRYQALLDAVFYLGYSKTEFEPKVSTAFLALKNKLGHQNVPAAPATAAKAEETVVVPSTATSRFEKLSSRKLRSTVQTYYRTAYSNHIQLSDIADKKAHIMISVNSIMLSVAISMLTYHSYTDNNPLLILPIVIFMVTGLTSLIFSVLSSRPRISTKVPETKDKNASNFIFFGNFVNLSLDEYEDAVDTMLRDGALLYGNMTRDIYYLGKVLDKKYRLLTFSYNVFMLGFVATVIAFLTVYFIGAQG